MLKKAYLFFYITYMKLFAEKDIQRIFRKSATPSTGLQYAKELYFVAKWISKNKHDLKKETDLFRGKLNRNFAQLDSPKIWVFWDKGFNSAPEIVQYLHKHLISHHHPKQVVSLCLENIQQFVPLPDDLWHSIKSPNHKANLLRLELLARHGGIWIDSTCLVQTNLLSDYLSSFFPKNRDFFALSEKQLPRIRNWFMASKRNGYIASAMLITWRNFTKENPDFCANESYHYFRWIFESLFYIDEQFRNAWERQSLTSDVLPSYCLVRTITKTKGDFVEACKCMPHSAIHKLNHKNPMYVNVKTIKNVINNYNKKNRE